MSKIKTITAISKATDPQLASKEIYQQLNNAEINFVLFFCASSYPLTILAKALDETFINTTIIGCTTAGELTQNGYEKDSIVAIGFSQQYFSISATIVKSMPTFNTTKAENTIKQLVEESRNNRWQASNSFILTLLDGLSSNEEQFLCTLHSVAQGTAQFGGSAGDSIKLTKTHVYYQGDFYENAAIILMVNTPLKFEVLSCQHIQQPCEKLVVTAADAQTRTVHELNAEPAALEYARLLNMDINDLNTEVFSLYPLAVKIGEHYYVRSIQKVNKDNLSLTFYCAVDVGIVLTSVEMGDIIAPVEDKLHEISLRYGQPELVLTCDCCLRRIEIEQKQLQPEVKALSQRYNIAGFNTYGEHLDGIHLNQTFTGVYISGEMNE